MAGWRVGFTVGTPNLVAALARIKNYHDYGAFTPLQVAAIAALEEGNQQSQGDAYAWFALIENKARIEQAGWEIRAMFKGYGLVQVPRAALV